MSVEKRLQEVQLKTMRMNYFLGLIMYLKQMNRGFDIQNQIHDLIVRDAHEEMGIAALEGATNEPITDKQETPVA